MSSNNVQVRNHELIKPWSYSMKILCIQMFIVAGEIAAQCPFQHLYHFGDGITDIGNSIHVAPGQAVNPAASWPYGSNSPGHPTGRWCDGLIDFDYTAADFGLPHIVPYMNTNVSEPNDGVIFSVARSPVLDIAFFESRNITIPPYAVPLSGQLAWFKEYMASVFPTPEDIANRLANSLVLMGDIEGNDIGYALSQGKSIEEVATYVPLIVATLINATAELIKMGATKVIVPGNAPLGCYPYILTALASDNPEDYDEYGCLKRVNEFIILRNKYLNDSLEILGKQHPGAYINYGNFYPGLIDILNQTRRGPNGDLALKSCCGTGGNYNYDSDNFCGSPGVPVCPYPEQYIFWDGLHFTQLAYARMETILVQPALEIFNCTRELETILKRPLETLLKRTMETLLKRTITNKGVSAM